MKKIFSLILAIILTFSTLTIPASAASKPGKVKITDISLKSSTSVKIKWKKVSGADGYEIYQKKGSGSYVKVKTITSGKTTTYTKKKLTTGKKYSYKIRAYDKVKSKKVYGKFSSVKTVKPVKITDEDTFKCLSFVMVSDNNYSENTENDTFRFAYDFLIFENKNAKYSVESVDVISATVNKGEKCKLMDTSNQKKVKKIAKSYSKHFYDSYNDFLSKNKLNTGKVVARVISPTLKDIEYNDFKIKVKVVFENGLTKTVTYKGSQSSGIGGNFYYSDFKDSDFQ